MAIERLILDPVFDFTDGDGVYFFAEQPRQH
jgi:hypothetical protein